MNYIGIRVGTTDIYYSIIQKKNSEFDIVSISSVKIPKALNIPEKLAYVRNTLITIIGQYDISYAAMRIIEGAAMSNINSSSLFRVNIEGVVQEVFAGSTIRAYDLACNASVSATLGTSSKKILDIFDELNLNGKYMTDNGCVLNDGQKESLVVAIAMLKKRGE